MSCLDRYAEVALRLCELFPRANAAGWTDLNGTGVYDDLASHDLYREAVEPARGRTAEELTVQPVLGTMTRALEQHRLPAVGHGAP